MEMPVTREQIEFYRENGFVQIDNVLTQEEIAEMAEAMEEAMTEKSVNAVKTDKSGGSYYRVLNQKVNVWRDHGVMAKYSLHPKVAEIARLLTGASKMRLFHDHALWKMPEDSKATPWHQDAPYWPLNQTQALSAWIPVDDVDEKNGCMMFVPGSHKEGKLKGIDFLNPQNIFDYVQDKEANLKQPVVVPLKKGSLTFHSGLTFHYAYPNMSDKPRRVLAIIYMPDGTTYSGAGHICTDNLGLQKDEPIQGGTFPILARGI